jgi:DNA polymerase-1
MVNPNRYTCDVLIVDGRHLLYRSADVNRAMTAEVNGEVIASGGVHGFLNVLVKLKRRYQGAIVVAWEGRDNFRFKLYPEYKRKKKPITDEMKEFFTELGDQERIVVDILAKLGVRQFRGVECEADDVIGTLVERLQNRRIAIFSGDSDLRQLVSKEEVVVLAPGKKGVEVKYDEEAVIERHGVRPTQLPDLKAIAGDSSDNIPGAKGIGDKGAAAMLVEYGTLGEVLRRAQGEDWEFTKRQKELIASSHERLRLFLQLTQINCDVTLLPHPIERDAMGARRLMFKMQLKRLLEAGTFADLKRLPTR